MRDQDILENIFISVPFQKVDKENRLVSGFATLDNVDRQGDLVTSECAEKAFAGWRRNLREMHGNSAIGRVTDIKNDTYFDPATNQTYKGIYVTAYVSKGAPEAWEKVLDETYSGFSIGGRMKEKETILKGGRAVRVINEMELYELSLVDSPANHLANIISIQKVDGQDDVVTGISADIKIDDVFYCKSCEILAPGQSEKSCIMCQSSMENIGWVENVGAKETTEKMSKMLDAYLIKNLSDSTGSDLADNSLQNEGGDLMSKENEEVIESDDASEATEDVVEESASENETAEDVVEQSDTETAVEADKESDTEEVAEEVVEEEVAKAIDFKAIITEALTEFTASQTEAVTKVLAEVTDNTEKRIESLKDEFAKALAEVTKSFNDRCEEVEKATATKKSGDLGGEPERIEKSVWNGAFAPGKRFFDNSNSIVE